MEKPLIAILTTTKNDGDSIADTLSSITSQTIESWEHIIKDAGSTDQTISILKKQGKNLTILSTPDKGIYDALNLALPAIKAEWCIVIQSGDKLHTPYILQKVLPYLTEEIDIAYGDVLNIKNGIPELKSTQSVTKLWKGMIGSHQGMFIRTSLLRKFPYDLQHTIAADYDFLWKAYTNGAHFKQIPFIISSAVEGGLSSTKIIENLKQKEVIASKYDNNLRHKFYRAARTLKVTMSKKIQSTMPKSLVTRIKALLNNRK